MRACLRCISKKRKCDHQQPTCSLCEKARENCTYPSESYRRGPIAGYVKVVEQRLEDLERALSFVLAQEGVRKVLLDPSYPPQSKIPEHDTLSDMSREDRPAWFEKHALHTVNDLLRYPTSPGPRDPASIDPDNSHLRRSTAETTGGPDVAILDEADSVGHQEQNVGVNLDFDWSFGRAPENPPESSFRSISQYWAQPPSESGQSVWAASHRRDTTTVPVTSSNLPLNDTPIAKSLGVFTPTDLTLETHIPRLEDVPPASRDRSNDLFW